MPEGIIERFILEGSELQLCTVPGNMASTSPKFGIMLLNIGISCIHEPMTIYELLIFGNKCFGRVIVVKYCNDIIFRNL